VAGAQSLPASACRAELAVVVRPKDLNTYQSVFGGYVMQRVDELATSLAADISGRAVVTAHLDRLTFSAGIRAFERMRLIAQATRTFRTSMEVRVRVLGEDPLTGRQWQTSEAALTVVGLDQGGRPAALPQIVPATPEEHAAYTLAESRRRARLAARDLDAAPPASPGPEDAERLALESMSRIVHGRHAGETGQASAGWILGLADELAAITASRHAGTPTVTVAVDDVPFLRPVPAGDVVTFRAYLTATFRSSMEVRVDVWQRPRFGRTAAPVARCAFTYVALGPDGRPGPVPPFLPRGEQEAARAAAARQRRARRGGGGQA